MSYLPSEVTQPRYSVRSLSPAFWFVCDAAKAQRERGRGQVGRPYASEAQARAALSKVTGSAA